MVADDGPARIATAGIGKVAALLKAAAILNIEPVGNRAALDVLEQEVGVAIAGEIEDAIDLPTGGEGLGVDGLLLRAVHQSRGQVAGASALEEQVVGAVFVEIEVKTGAILAL